MNLTTPVRGQHDITLLRAIADLSGARFDETSREQLLRIIDYKGSCAANRCHSCMFNLSGNDCMVAGVSIDEMLVYATILMRRYI